jgi:hypothetical protein
VLGEQLVQLPLVQVLVGEEPQLELEQVLQLEQVLVQRSRHRNREQLLLVSMRHHASRESHQHCATANCRGQSASCQKQCWSQQR